MPESFADHCTARGLRVLLDDDRVIGCWEPGPGHDVPGVLVDGEPAPALEALDLLREQGVQPHGRIGLLAASGDGNRAVHRVEIEGNDGAELLTFAMLVLAADKQARLLEGGATARFAGIDVRPDRVSASLEIRTEAAAQLVPLAATIARQGRDRADRDGTTLQVTPQSVSLGAGTPVADWAAVLTALARPSAD